MRTAVVAIGGNALITLGERGTSQEELRHARTLAGRVADMIAGGWSVVVAHGNGPQVGFIMRRSELSLGLDPTLPPLTLDQCVAETQGGLGYLLALAISNELSVRELPDRVAAIVTRAVVATDDPAFALPTKPVGGFCTRAQADRYRSELGWTMQPDAASRGYRRAVPSPEPVAIPEVPAVEALLARGYTVIAAGGGGVPVAVTPSGEQRGVEAVVDKDLASSLLATDLGADLLVLCTDVDAVARDFRKPTQTWLDRLDVEEAERLLAEGQFPPGSMGPKVRAAVRFARATDGWSYALITSSDRLADALAGRTGTRITAAPVLAHW